MDKHLQFSSAYVILGRRLGKEKHKQKVSSGVKIASFEKSSANDGEIFSLGIVKFV